MKGYLLAASMALTLLAGPAMAADCPALLQHELPKLRSKETIDLCEEFNGKTLVVVNTASFCGFAPQFKGLEALYQRYKDEGLARISHSPAHWAVLTDAGRRRWRRLPTALISGKRLRARLNKALAAGWTGCDVEGDGGCAAVSAPRRSRHRRRDRTPPAAGRPNSWPL